MKNLSSQQQKVLNFYNEYVKKHGVVPTYQTVGDALGISKSVVFSHVKNLEKSHYLFFNSLPKNQSYEIIKKAKSDLRIPILGEVACGEPIEILDDEPTYFDMPEMYARGGGNFYALRAKGDSMKKVNIASGDLLFIRKQDDVDDGDIGVVVMSEFSDDSRATLKRVFRNKNSLLLKSENDDFPHTLVSNAVVRGKLVGSWRMF